MSTLVLGKNNKKPRLKSAQETFNRHRRKIDQLYHQLQVVKNECEQALEFYHKKIAPQKRKNGDLIVQFLFKLMNITNHPKSLNKEARKVLHEDVYEEALSLVFAFVPNQDIPEAIKDLYKKVHGRSQVDAFQNERAEVQEFLKEEMGIDDIDLSSCDINDSFSDIMQKIAQTLHQAHFEKIETPPPEQKSEKELAKEKKAIELEALQNKKLNYIYKRLAKVFHPDLEQDAEKKIEKTDLMKRLTVAYDDKDLISLLLLESEWLGETEGTSVVFDDETLKIYNSILKGQIEELKGEIHHSSFDPRYMEISHFIEDPARPLKGVQNALSELYNINKNYVSMLKDISGKDPLGSLKEILSILAFRGGF